MYADELYVKVPRVPGFEIEELESYDSKNAWDCGELRYFESPWKGLIPVSQTLMRWAVEPEVNTIIAARESETGRLRSTMEISSFPMIDAGHFNVGAIAYMGFTSTHPDFRRRGLYTAIWGQGLNWLVRHNVSDMIWNSNPNLEWESEPIREEARKLYKKFGAKILAIPDPEDPRGQKEFYGINVIQGIKVYRDLQVK